MAGSCINLCFLRNPTLEDQALARIHRIGQTKEVNTVRFIVRDSFEEVRTHLSAIYLFNTYLLTAFYIQRVVELQQSKTDLASVILRQNESEQSDGARRPLEVGALIF
jgi:hypothetical protein